MQRIKIKKTRWLILTSVITIAIIFVILYFIEFVYLSQKSMGLYQEQQDKRTKMMHNDALDAKQDSSSPYAQELIKEINTNFETSLSSYCIVVQNGNIIYLKDDNTTSALDRNSVISDYFNKDNICADDGYKYIISKSEYRIGVIDYELIVCTRQNYIKNKLYIDEMRLHCIGYFVVYAATMSILLAWLFSKHVKLELSRLRLKEELEDCHVVIEGLEADKLKNYVDSEKLDSYAFYNREIVEEIINQMTDEERKNCIDITINIVKFKSEHVVQITSILGRIRQGKSISCFWGDSVFKVVLFDADKSDAEQFIDLFINKYKSDTTEQIGDLNISASWLNDTLA